MKLESFIIFEDRMNIFWVIKSRENKTEKYWSLHVVLVSV